LTLFVLSWNQAANLLSRNEKHELTAFLKNIGANHSLQNLTFEFSPKTQYARAAPQSGAALSEREVSFCAEYLN